jgi:hypothetical protein
MHVANMAYEHTSHGLARGLWHLAKHLLRFKSLLWAPIWEGRQQLLFTGTKRGLLSNLCLHPHGPATQSLCAPRFDNKLICWL